MRITIQGNAAEQWKQNFQGAARDWSAALKTAANMAASMIQEAGRADIKSAGRFDEFADALQVSAETGGDEVTITMTLDHPGASIFETGGTIDGNPLLWLPISDTDAEGIPASDYPGKLFSVNSPKSTHPLLFSEADKAPKYFGIESVMIPKKFHLEEIAETVMDRFEDIFNAQLKK